MSTLGLGICLLALLDHTQMILAYECLDEYGEPSAGLR